MIIFGDGRQTRDFIYVSDTAEGIVLSGLLDEAVGETINLGSGREISINDLAKEVLHVTGCVNAKVEHDAPRPGDTQRLCADINKASKFLQFHPKVSLREGIARIKDWYLGLGVPPEKLLEEEVVYNWKAPNVKAHA